MCIIVYFYFSASLCVEKLQKGQHRHQDIQKELSQQHATELSRLQAANDDTEKSYKERIRRLEDHRKEVEEELRKVKSQQLAERLNFEEQLMHTKQKVKEEEVMATGPVPRNPDAGGG